MFWSWLVSCPSPVLRPLSCSSPPLVLLFLPPTPQADRFRFSHFAALQLYPNPRPLPFPPHPSPGLDYKDAEGIMDSPLEAMVKNPASNFLLSHMWVQCRTVAYGACARPVLGFPGVEGGEDNGFMWAWRSAASNKLLSRLGVLWCLPA